MEASFMLARSALLVIYVRHASLLTCARSDFDGKEAAEERVKGKRFAGSMAREHRPLLGRH